MAQPGKRRIALLDAFSLCYVVNHGQRNRPPAERNRAPLDFDVHDRPVLLPVPPHAGVPDLVVRLRPHNLMQILDHGRHILGRSNVSKRQPLKFLGGIAVVLDGRLIALQDGKRLVVEHQHRLRVAVEDQAIPLFALSQRLFGLLAVADVPRVNHHPGNVAIVQPVLADSFQIAPGAIPVPKPIFGLDGTVRVFQARVECLQYARQILGMHEREGALPLQFPRFIPQHALD